MVERDYSDFPNAKDALDAFNAIMKETRPIEGHSDPGAINDCADMVREFLAKASQHDDSDEYCKCDSDHKRLHGYANVPICNNCGKEYR